MDLLVSYPWNHYVHARREITHTLRRFGDENPAVKRTGVHGVALVHTSLEPRDVTRRCKELFHAEKVFEFAIKWVPVDYWCDANLDEIKKVIEENVKDRIKENETWGMKVEKRRWREYHTDEIVEYLAKSIERKVNLKNPDKIVRIDVVGEKAAVSLLKPGEIFSITAPE